MFNCLLLSILALLSIQTLVSGHLVEPAYPRLHNGRNKLHLISEKFDSKDGYSTQEEFVDFNTGKGAFIERRPNSHQTILTDAASHTTYVYKPYSCEGKLYPDLPDSLQSPGGESRFGDISKFTTIDKQGEVNNWYLFGVTSLWNRVEWFSKSYASLDEHIEDRHRWTVKEDDFTVELYFKESASGTTKIWNNQIDNLSLSRVVLRTKDGRLTSINILSLDFELDEQVYQDQFQLPLMYGCQRLEAHDEKTLEKIALIERLMMEKYHLKMEVSATKVVNVHDKPTDSMSLEFARSRHEATRMQMIHQINTRQDIKTVLDDNLSVKYTIDRRLGTCRMTNLGNLADDPTFAAGLGVEFSNGLKWEFSDKMMNFLFYELAGLELIRIDQDKQTPGFEEVYFQGNEWNLTGRDQYTRLVRKYSLWSDFRLELESTTVWFLGADLKLKEVYHFNILDSNLLGASLSHPQEARLFDVSHECYLDNHEVMQYGRDYVWLQLHYPVPDSNRLTRLAQLTAKLEEEFYQSLTSSTNVSHFRVPKMEFLFLDSGAGFDIRLLLLDSPPLHLIYNRAEGYLIDHDQGDLAEVAPTLEHCSELCRIHRCEGMSFCQGDFSCVLSLTQDKLGSKMKSADGGCATFRKPKSFNESQYYDGRLSNVVSRLRRLGDANWLADMPKPPEEAASFDEAGFVDPEKASLDFKLRNEYIQTMREYLDRVGISGFSVVNYLWRMMLVLVPNRIDIEQDSAVGGIDKLGVDSQMLSFHKGLHKQRYNYNSFRQTKEDGQRRARRLTGVDYDQCSLACIDGKCSSFSHCKQRKECILTDIYDIRASGEKYIQADADCVIVQRDFLSKFNKFSGVKPQATRTTEPAANPSECAHTCVARSDFNCLAFTHCKGSGCVYSDSRDLDSSEADSNQDCDHYTRSYLADFTRLESKQIQETALSEMQTSTFEGQSVDRCAEICATELMDCSAFQFCYDPELHLSQRCIMIQDTTHHDATGKSVLAHNESCHVFTLRGDSSEAKIRQLALTDPEVESTGGANNPNKAVSTTTLLSSLGSLLLLFLCSTLVFSVLGLVSLFALRRIPSLRSRVDRMRAAMGRY